MKLPIDVAFLDKDNIVLGIISGLVPYRVSGPIEKAQRARIAEGHIEEIRTEVGDQLEFPWSSLLRWMT